MIFAYLVRIPLDDDDGGGGTSTYRPNVNLSTKNRTELKIFMCRLGISI